MLSTAVTYIVLSVTLVAVAAYAIIVSRKMDVHSTKSFVSASNTQTAVSLAWCFFASGMGSWTLFSYPEIGVLAGTWGVIGYTLSGVLGVLVLGVVGPYTRSAFGNGVSFTEFIATRFGKVMQYYVALIAVFYQFISLVSELTCVGDLAVILSPNAHPSVAIMAVVIMTNIYLLIGGLRASLATDVWQGAGVLSLVLIVCIAMAFVVHIPAGAWKETKVAAFTVDGFETLVTLVIAVVSANMFFTGFWQRVYSAVDDATLRKACLLSCFMIVPFTVSLALAGMVSYLAYPDGTYFFSILLNMGRGWQILVGVVIAALASSCADTIQIGIAAELVTNFPSLSLNYARLICALLNIPAVFIALKGYNILTLFLIADLLCTATVGPMLLGAWKKATSVGAIFGCLSGLLTIFIVGWIVGGSFVDGFNWFGLPEGLYSQNSMITFILALIIPILTTVGVSLAWPSKMLGNTPFMTVHTPLTCA